MNISYKLKGLNKTINSIKLMSEKMQNRVNDDIHAAGAETETYAKSNSSKYAAPINKQPTVGGTLRAATIANNTERFKSIISNPIEYAPYVEFGTRAHVIRVKNAKNLSNGKTGFGKVVNHPGTRAQPFLRPSFDLAVKNLKKAIKKSLSKI